MITSTILGLLIPFIGTSLGAACVLFMKNELSVKTTKMLSGFAAGVMIAASVWSLLIPALEQSQSLGKMQFVPAVAGFMLGMFFLLILDTITKAGEYTVAGLLSEGQLIVDAGDEDEVTIVLNGSIFNVYR